MSKDKIFEIVTPFELEVKSADGGSDDEELYITGYASTSDKDRSDDVILAKAWKEAGAMDNYLKNPVILAYHNMEKPIGKTVDHKVDKKGLKITAKISKTAGDVLTLIKEGVLSTFSVGFMVKDADYDKKTGIFVIKEVELYEVSVVAIPANAAATFSVSKSFSSDEEFTEFKNKFEKSENIKETLMEKKDEVKQEAPVDLAKFATEVAAMVKSSLDAEKKAAADREEAETKAKESVRIEATTAAERLVKELEGRMKDDNKTIQEALAGITEALKANKDEVEATLEQKQRKNKMAFVDDDDSAFKLTDNQKDGLLFAQKLSGKAMHETKAFQNLVTKSGREHWDSLTAEAWEESYSTRVENVMREQLIVESLFSVLPMSTPQVTMPINPEAGNATWVNNAAFRSDTAPYTELGDGTDTSTGVAQTHQLLDQTMIAYKLATREYIGYEEEEDSIVSLAPIIRDAISRRMARSSDLAVLRGAGDLTTTGAYDPIEGVVNKNTVNPVSVNLAASGGWKADLNEDVFADMRFNLGLYGLEASRLVFIASHELYFELLKLPNFKTIDVYGAKATIITGEVGSIFGVKVVVSHMFDNAAIASADTVGTVLGCMVYPPNFMIGQLRATMTEAGTDIINQKRVLVSSRRFGFQDIISGAGAVNLEFTSA